jgi:hypothetical protein
MEEWNKDSRAVLAVLSEATGDVAKDVTKVGDS